LFLAKVILQYSQFNSLLQTRCCGSMSCCVGMCCIESSWLGVRRMLHSMSCCVGMCCIESGWLGVRRMLHSMSCCVGMCCRESGLARCASYALITCLVMSCCVGMCCRESSWLGVRRMSSCQHDMLPQHLVCINELNREYCNITLARNNKAP